MIRSLHTSKLLKENQKCCGWGYLRFVLSQLCLGIGLGLIVTVHMSINVVHDSEICI